jgi:serine phosphatase RsbU (regulator of sigma subunit)
VGAVEQDQPLAIAPADTTGERLSPLARARATTSILLVDDDENGLLALRAALEPLGQRLVAARSGVEALRHLLREEFAAILLDVRMPGLDGLQTARYIHARARTRHIPIIFLTAHAQDVEQAFHAYAAGAVDYVVKPCDPRVLCSKVMVFVELQRERGERVREAQARVAAETIAGALQRHLLPDRLPAVPSMAMAARYRPAERAAQVGGDWYDAIVLPGGGVGLAIGDVVGHGVHAATLMGELRAALRAYALTEPRSPGAALTLLNALCTQTHGEGMIATVLYMVIDPDGEHARFASAGHPPPLLRGAEGARLLEHRPLPPLGVARGASFESWDAELRPGETAVLYTDGLIERRGESLDVGFARLRGALEAGPVDVEELCSHILARVPRGAGLQDDAALLAVRLLEAPGDLQEQAEDQRYP